MGEEREQGDLKNMILCPITHKNTGVILGILEIWNKRELSFNPSESSKKFSNANLHFVKNLQGHLGEVFELINDSAVNNPEKTSDAK